jgi:hypothetical protein
MRALAPTENAQQEVRSSVLEQHKAPRHCNSLATVPTSGTCNSLLDTISIVHSVQSNKELK